MALERAQVFHAKNLSILSMVFGKFMIQDLTHDLLFLLDVSISF